MHLLFCARFILFLIFDGCWTWKIFPTEMLRGCLVCVICNSNSIYSFIFKLCIMIVPTLKVCTSFLCNCFTFFIILMGVELRHFSHLSVHRQHFRGAKFVWSVTSEWVVTWFSLGYAVRMLEYIVRTFWSNVGRFLYVSSSIPKKLYTIFQPTVSPIKRYQDSIFKLFTLSTNSVTKKMIVVRTAYFYNSGLIFVAKKNCDRDCTQSKKLHENILASFNREKWGLEKGV